MRARATELLLALCRETGALELRDLYFEVAAIVGTKEFTSAEIFGHALLPQNRRLRRALEAKLGADFSPWKLGKLFAQYAGVSIASAMRASYEKHGGMTPGFQADVHVATAKLAAEAAREFTNKRADRLALRLDAAEKAIAERDDQIKRHQEHLHRLQTKVATLELLAKGEKR